MSEEIKKFEDSHNPYAAITVRPIAKGFYKTRIFDPEMPRLEGNQKEETFQVFDDRLNEDIEILAKREHRSGRRFKSVELLGSWMERVDGGPNPAVAKRERALKRKSSDGIRKPMGTHQIGPMHPEQRHAGLDANTELMDYKNQEIARLKARIAEQNLDSASEVLDNKPELTNQLPTESVEVAGESGLGEAEAATLV